MRYVSTRGGGTPQTFTQILLEGLAPDGGRFVHDAYPCFAPAELAAMRRWTCHCERGEAISVTSNDAKQSRQAARPEIAASLRSSQ